MEKIVMIADRYIRIQECDEGFDYTIYDLNFKELDGGIMEEDCTLEEALKILLQELRNKEGYANCVYGRIQPNSLAKELPVDGLENFFDADVYFSSISTYSIFSYMDETALINPSNLDLEKLWLVGAGFFDSNYTADDEADITVKAHHIKNQVLVLQLNGDVKTYFVDENGVCTEDFTLFGEACEEQAMDRDGKMYIYSPFVGNVPVYVSVVVNQGKLSVSLLEEEDGMKFPYANLTVVIDGPGEDETHAYVDTNNLPNACDFIEKYGLGEYEGIQMRSGYCMYPLYRFNIDKLREYM